MRLNTTQRESGLVGHWKFDEPTLIHDSKAMDSSGWGNHGTLSTGDGALNKSVAGKLGKGLSFDGSDDSVNISTVLPSVASTNKGTISLWFKPTALPNNKALISFNRFDGANVYLRIWNGPDATRDKLNIGVLNSSWVWLASSDNVVLTIGNWVFITLVQGGVSPVLYVNGNLTPITFGVAVDKTAWYNSLILTTAHIGSRVGTNDFINGLIDDVRIYKRALTAGEVRALFENTKLVTTPMIVPKTPIPVIQQHRLNQGAR